MRPWPAAASGYVCFPIENSAGAAVSGITSFTSVRVGGVFGSACATGTIAAAPAAVGGMPGWYSLLIGTTEACAASGEMAIQVAPPAVSGLPYRTRLVDRNFINQLTGAGYVAGISAGVTVTTNNDKTGYTASTVTDKTGYSVTSGTLTDKAGFGITSGTLSDKAGYSLAADQSSVTVGTTKAVGSNFDKSAYSITSGTLTDKTGFGITSGTLTDKSAFSLAADQSGVIVGTAKAMGTQAQTQIAAVTTYDEAAGSSTLAGGITRMQAYLVNAGTANGSKVVVADSAGAVLGSFLRTDDGTTQTKGRLSE